VIEAEATVEGESAIPLEGMALGVDHLEALVVFLVSSLHTYARWVKTGAEISAPTVAAMAREAYAAAATASARIDPTAHKRREASPKPQHPWLTIEDADHLVMVNRVRSFGIAMVFERDAPIGLARAFAHKIVSTLEHELPYAAETRPVVVERRPEPTPEPPAAARVSSRPLVGPTASPAEPDVPRIVAPSAPPVAPEAPKASEASLVGSSSAVHPSPPPPSPQGPTEARTLVSQVSPVLPARPDRVSVPPPVLVPEVVPEREARREPGPIAPPAIVTAPVIQTLDTSDASAADGPFGNGPDTIAKPRMAPTAAEIAAVLGEDRAPASTDGRARRLIQLLEDRSVEPHLVRTRLGLRTGLGLEPLVAPRGLGADALLLIETAAEDLLGVDHEGLVALLKSSAEEASR
jgi:hypothetical protein